MASLRDELRVAAGTAVKYETAVMDYARRTGGDPCVVREPDVRRYVAALRDLSPSTVRVRLSAIRSFHQWLSSETGCQDPTVRIRAPRRPDRLPKALNAHEVGLVLATCEGPGMLDVRDRAILEALYSTGCRAAELLTATLADVDLERRTLTVIGKGNRQRVTLLGDSAALAMQAWLMTRSSGAGRGEQSLFVSKLGRRLSSMGLWKLVRDRAKRAGLKQHVHPHMFRHTCATHLLKGGADLRSIQLLLGHRNLASTQMYLAVDDEWLRKVHTSAHPRGGAVDARLRTVGGGGAMDGQDEGA